MLTMAHRVPVLHELQDQLNIRVGSSSGPVLCRAQAGHAHRHGHKTQLPGLALFKEGARHHPAGTTTLPGFPPLDQGELWGPESFPHHIQGADSHPQHQQQDPTQSSAGPTICPALLFSCPGGRTQCWQGWLPRGGRETPNALLPAGTLKTTDVQKIVLPPGYFAAHSNCHKKSQAQTNVE